MNQLVKLATKGAGDTSICYTYTTNVQLQRGLERGGVVTEIVVIKGYKDQRKKLQNDLKNTEQCVVALWFSSVYL